MSLGISDSAKAKWTDHYLAGSENEINGPWEQRIIDYGLLPIFESERIYQAKKKIRERNYFRDHSHIRKLCAEDLGRLTSEICGVLIPRFNGTLAPTSRLVLTENTKTNLRNIASTIVTEKPLLLQSVQGAGKSFLIDEISKLFGRFEGVTTFLLVLMA
jgi:midasin